MHRKVARVVRTGGRWKRTRLAGHLASGLPGRPPSRRHCRRGTTARWPTTQYLPFELVDDVLEQTKTVQRTLARPAPSPGCTCPGAGDVPAAGICPGVGEADRRAGGGGRAVPVGEGAAGPGADGSPGTAEGAVRGGGRAAGPAGHARRAVRRAAHRRVRRPEFPQGPRYRPQPVLAGPDPLPDGPGRIPHAAADGPGRDRHPRPARRRYRLGGRPGRGRAGPAAAAPIKTGHAGPARPRL